MSRAGEKLYGDWERRLRDEAESTPWRRWLTDALTFASAVLLLGCALFGYG